MYCYSDFRGVPNPAHIVSKNNKMDLVNYYRKVEKDANVNPIITFGIKTLPQYEPVYVLKYSEDSLIAKVVSYYNRGFRLGGSYTVGWVYIGTLHETPPTK